MTRKQELIMVEVQRRVKFGIMSHSQYAKFLADIAKLEEVSDQAWRLLAGIISQDEYDKFVALLLLNERRRSHGKASSETPLGATPNDTLPS